MVVISQSGGRAPYSFYAVVGFVFTLLYAVGVLLVLLMPQEYLSVTVRDVLSGAFLVGVLFGMPVVILVGFLAIVYARLERKRGTLLGILTILAPVIFLFVLNLMWQPDQKGFWEFRSEREEASQIP